MPYILYLVIFYLDSVNKIFKKCKNGLFFSNFKVNAMKSELGIKHRYT